jgi:hypothetical protein
LYRRTNTRGMLRNRAVVALLLATALVSCQRPSTPAGRKAPPRLISEPVPRDRLADDVGRFLAGLPGTAGDPFVTLESQEAWQEHRRASDAVWKKVDEAWMPAIAQFRKTELSGRSIEDSIVFYPFSGPDTLMLTAFFPRNAIYVMVGLEPAGTLPRPRRMTEEELSAYLADVRDTVSSELVRSFFITREMDKEFRGQVTDGLFAPILLLLTRTHHTVLGYRYVRLDERGHVIGRAADYKAPGRIGNKGVEIDFRADSDQSLHRLFYFSVNLSDSRLEQNQPFRTFLAGLKGVTTFLKATSYMPHQPGFGTIRRDILADSDVILQDDSGIPYRFFDPAQWSVKLFGGYTAPYGSFRYLVQPDLRNAYETSRPEPLSFRIGYGFSRIPSNLQLAIRKR